MTWLTWRQLRVQSMLVLAAAGALALALVLTAHGLRTAYRADLATFIDQLQFQKFDGFLYVAGLVAVLSAPPVIAAFWGGPLIARELETGTHRLVWNQSTTRRRWLAMKLAVTGAIAVAVCGLLGLVVSWWSSPIDRAVAAGHGSGRFSLPRLDPVVFGARGIVSIGYVVFGLAAGVALGLLLRRSIPAVAVTLVVVAAAEILVPRLVRPHLVSPAVENVVISRDNLQGIQIQGSPNDRTSGPVRLTVRSGSAGDWGLANETVDSTGRVASTLPSWLGTCLREKVGAPPDPSQGTTKTRAPGRDALEPCFARLASEGYRQHVTYQPARHFWSLQLRETALLLLLAGLLVGFCFWRIDRDVS
ncbi:MAG: hypothetical protein JWP11_2427 [Frankiales bacterium]|nr:hypothetical protein [Frankiales bacterium]